MDSAASPKHALHSRALDTDYRLYAAEALSSDQASLVLALDGEDQYSIVAKAAAQLAKQNRLPKIHLIGIGYGGSYRPPHNRRARDYTPTKAADEPMETGGGNAFLQFVAEELLPFLAQHYAFSRDDVGIVGHSLGSLLGLYALVLPNAIFRRYLISSPSIWWDNRSVMKWVEKAATISAVGRKAYFSIGNRDTESMRGDFALLEQSLAARPIPALEYKIQHFPDKDHYNVLPVAMEEGLAWLYGKSEICG